jgi:hypothetical protein
LVEIMEREMLKRRAICSGVPSMPGPSTCRCGIAGRPAQPEPISASRDGNPTGILVERDELVSLLQHLDRDEQCVAKGFFRQTQWRA